MTAAILVLLAHYLLAGDVADSSFTDGMEAAARERSTDGTVETDAIVQSFFWGQRVVQPASGDGDIAAVAA